MKIEEELFHRYKVNEDKLSSFGFRYVDNKYIKEYKLSTDNLTAVITIIDNNISGKIIDDDFGDELILFNTNNAVGEYIGKINEEYQKILLDIRDNCYNKVLFHDDQANRIARKIYDKYNEEPDFPWEKYPYIGVFRHKENKLWYGLVMEIGDDVLGKGIKGRTIINIKLPPETITELVKLDNIFPAYHMNKKSWISLSLSDYFSDEDILKWIDISYEITKSKKK